MTDQTEQIPGDHDCEDAFERALRRLRTEGVEKATEAAIDLCTMKDGPAQARSAAVNAIFRAAGLFDKREGDGEPEPHEMSAAELERATKRMMKMRDEVVRGAERRADEDGGEYGVFD